MITTVHTRSYLTPISICFIVAFLFGMISCTAKEQQDTTTPAISSTEDAAQRLGHPFDGIVRSTPVDGYSNELLGADIKIGSSDSFARSAANLGDWDGADGPIATVLAVTNMLDQGGPYVDIEARGALYIVYLLADGSVFKHRRITPESLNPPPISWRDNSVFFGNSVAYLGDLDGEGPSIAAVAVGAFWHAAASRNHTIAPDGGRGGVYILYLLPDGSVLKWTLIDEDAQNGPELNLANWFGYALADMGDFDGAGPSVRVLAVGAPYDSVRTSDYTENANILYLFYLLADGSIYKKVEITQGTQRMPEGRPLLYDQFGAGLAYLPHKSKGGVLAVSSYRDDSLSLTDDSFSENYQRGVIYLLRLNPDGSILNVTMISNKTQNIPNFHRAFGRRMASLQTLLLESEHGPQYLLAASSFIGASRSNPPTTVIYLLYLNGDLSVHSSYEFGKTSPTQLPADYTEFEYWGDVVDLGILDPTKPHQFAVGLRADYRTANTSGSSLFIHTIHKEIIE